jgi:hypothetical protein
MPIESYASAISPRRTSSVSKNITDITHGRAPVSQTDNPLVFWGNLLVSLSQEIDDCAEMHWKRND